MIAKFLKRLLALFEPATLPATVPQHGPQPAPTGAEGAPGSVRVPGKEIALGGVLYVVAPLNAAAVKQYRDEIKAVFVGGLPDIELVAKLAHASLRRNYPAITMEKVEDLIDYDNFFEVWESLLNMSGLVAQAKEMARRVQAQMETADSTP